MKNLQRALLFVLIAPTLALAQATDAPMRSDPPKGISIPDVIRAFAQKEGEFAKAREQYTYRQSVKVQTMDDDRVDGEYQQVTDINFDSQGRRLEQVIYAPQNTITRVSMTTEDFNMIRNIIPFVVTPETMVDYTITYVGQQKVDELDTYVFDINPKQLLKGKLYFDGRVWVDQQDLQVVMSSGKNVFDAKNKHKEDDQQFPRFTTWREQIDGHFWFPTYCRADDLLHFPGGKHQMAQDVHIREIIKFTNYKRFGTAVKITYDGSEVMKGEKAAAPASGPPTGTAPASKPPKQ